MLKKIASFTINHDVLLPGLYISRVDGDCVTYDLRMKRPNMGDYVAVPAMHTIEHLVATYVRSSELSDAVVYFGPMGCRTGCYLIVRDSVSTDAAIDLVRRAYRFAADFEGKIPGTEPRECGNYLEHDLQGGRAEAAAYAAVIENWTAADTVYPE